QFAGVTRITQNKLNEEVESSAGKMMNAAVFGQIIILIVYLPILTLTGIEGKMFRPMAQTVSFALIGAFLLSLTYVPMMSSLCLSKKLAHKDTWADKMMKRLQGWYRPFLKKALAFPKVVVVFTLLLFGWAIFIMSRLGGEFIPKLEEGDFAVDARLLTGSSLTETIKLTQKAAAILQDRFPEVEKIVTRIGASEIPTDPMPLEMTDIMITLKPKKEWTSASSFDELAELMSKALEEIPGMTNGFQYPVQMRFNELISGARQDIVCKIFGENLDSLSAYANQMGNIVSTVEGAKDIYIEIVTGLPQVVIKYNRELMAHYHLNVDDVNRVIRTAFAGEAAGVVYENERRYDLVVRLQDEKRKDISDVQQLLIPTPSGLQVPLYQVATVDIKEGPNQIQRENAQRRIMVGFNVRGRDVESVVEELSSKVESELKFTAGYYVKYGGQFENLVEATQRLSIAVPVALLLILVMLYFAFGSLKYGLLIFSAIPLSAIGGILALWLRDLPFSISAGVGFIALFGVAVLNGIVLISEFNRLKQSGLKDIQQIIMEGTQIRLRPVLMTASVASLGFLPMALSQGAGAEVQRPLATVVIGGLITATMLTLVVLPLLYRWFEKGGMKKMKIKPAATVILFLLLGGSVQSQQRLTLDEMLRMGSDKNLNLQSVKKKSDYWKQLQSGVFDPGKTQVGGEYGGINGVKNDTRFFVSQGFNLPIVYRRQQQLYKSEQSAQQQLANWKEAELHREIKLVFYALVDALERKRWLQRLDSVYSRFQQSANLRLQAGESNVLEKTTADAQLQQLLLQQQQLDADILIGQQQLQWLLHTDELFLPAYTHFKKENIVLADTSAVAAHPQIQFNKLQEKTAAAQTLVERTKLSPDFAVGYSNQSI
ncbi:MAG TPA: efflux RND transporter permease subunit, partial [Agriterribacter sp.]|nr:efflux RND transporter permease subunit [Agriterribacter sp.]